LRACDCSGWEGATFEPHNNEMQQTKVGALVQVGGAALAAERAADVAPASGIATADEQHPRSVLEWSRKREVTH